MSKNKGSFKAGSIPWNKGIPMHLSPDTEFKAGPDHEGATHPSWKGGNQMPQNDCVHLWAGNGMRERRPRVIYKNNFGDIPTGYVVIHKDGDRYNDDPSNLEAISRAENLRRNNLNKQS